MIEYSEVVATLNEKKPSKKRVQITKEKRFGMGKYTTVNGATNAVKRFKKTHPHLTFAESTTRKLRDRYNDNTKQKRAVDNKIPRLKRGRSLVLGAVLDEKMRHFSLQLRKKGGVVNTVVAVATAKALIARSSDEYLKLIDLELTTWAKSLFKLMGFCKRAATTSKPEIPELVKREANYFYNIKLQIWSRNMLFYI